MYGKVMSVVIPSPVYYTLEMMYIFLGLWLFRGFIANELKEYIRPGKVLFLDRKIAGPALMYTFFVYYRRTFSKVFETQ